MLNLFMKIIEQLNGCAFVLLGILALVSYAFYKIGSWKQLFFTHNDRIEKMSDTLISIQKKVDLIYQYSSPNVVASSITIDFADDTTNDETLPPPPDEEGPIRKGIL